MEKIKNQNRNLNNIKQSQDNSGFGPLSLALLWVVVLVAVCGFGAYHKDFFSEELNIAFITALSFLVLAILARKYDEGRFGDILPLHIIAIASLIIGVLGGGLFGFSASVILWPLLLGLYSPRSRIMGIVITIGVAIILGALSIIGLPIDASLAKWTSLLANGITLALLIPTILLSKEKAQSDENLVLAQNEIEEAKIQANERTRFIAEMSHEIRTPLNAILGFSDIMREGLFGKLSPQYLEYAELIHQSGSHLLDMVGDLLDMSKIEAGKYKLNKDELDITKVARDAIRMIAGSANRAKVSLEFHGNDGAEIYGDERSIRQIMLNLLSNAIKFTPQNGKVKVRVFGNEDKIWLEVSDNGRGMGDEELRRVGEPYLSSENTPPGARGTGLGLALVRTLTQMHDGKFEITSKIGAGTDVTLEFPKFQHPEQTPQ